MFTTGNHYYLYAVGVAYLVSLTAHLLSAKKISITVFTGALIVHGLYLVGRGWLSGVFYANPIFEGPFFLPWCMAASALLVAWTRRESLATPLVVATVIFVALAMVYAKGVIPPTPKKLSILAVFFFFTENAGHAFFYCGAALALGRLITKKNDEIFHNFLVWGFVFFSVSQVVGAGWCYFGWGNTFRFSPRHFTSAAIWIMYAAYLHLKYTAGWSKHRKSLFALIASVLLFLATYAHYLREMAFTRVGG